MKIVVKTPTRLSFFGGGADLPVFYMKHRGIVISMAIDIYQNLEITNTNQQIFYPPEANENFYWGVLNDFGIGKSGDFGFKASFDGFIESGLGSSAACAVGLVAAASKIKGLEMTKAQIAERAWDIEVNKMKMYGGKQDQYASVFGGMNVIFFNKLGIKPDPFERERAEALVDQTLLFYIGENRKNPKIQERLRILNSKQIKSLMAMVEISEAAIGYMWTGNWFRLAGLLNESWKYKKLSNSGMTTDRIDEIYIKAGEAGAVGGKLCGSGGGGHMIFMVPPEKHAGVTDALIKLGCTPIDFKIDWNGVMVKGER